MPWPTWKGRGLFYLTGYNPSCRHAAGTQGRRLKQKPRRKAACCFVCLWWLPQLSFKIQLRATGLGKVYSHWARSSYFIYQWRKCPPNMPTGQSNRDNSSIKVHFSQVSLVHVTLTIKTSQYRQEHEMFLTRENPTRQHTGFCWKRECNYVILKNYRTDFWFWSKRKKIYFFLLPVPFWAQPRLLGIIKNNWG